MTNADKTPKTDRDRELAYLRNSLVYIAKTLDDLVNQINVLIKDELGNLDGSDASAVSILTGYSKEELDDLGGLPAHLLAGRLEVQQQRREHSYHMFPDAWDYSDFRAPMGKKQCLVQIRTPQGETYRCPYTIYD